MIEQGVRLRGAPAPRDTSGRCHHRITLRPPERDCDHILREVFAIAHARIEPSVDDVDERAFGYDFQIDLRIGLKKRPDHRRQHQVNRGRRCVDAKPPRGHLAQPSHPLQRLADLGHRRRRASQQHFAGLRQSDATGGAVQEANAQPLLQPAQPLAKARYRHALLPRCAAEITGARNRDEGCEVPEIEVSHCSL
jgi:hypothetical protein